MKTFKNVMTEAERPIEELNVDFLRRAEVVSSFNLQAADFQTLDYKHEIQYLFKKNFFPEFDLNQTVKSLDVPKLNKLIRQLKAMNADAFQRLHKYPLRGVGPGEATLYFLIDTAYLGGGASAGTDLFIGGKGYEIKAGRLSQDGWFSNFKLGGTVQLSNIISNALELKRKAGLEIKGNEINKTEIAHIKSKFPDEWMKNVEQPYEQIAAPYFGKQETIFMINSNPRAIYGEIAAVKQVQPDEIALSEITSNTIKPMVRA